ncbi:triggering receptor expressed on myeloid cells 2-like [Mixophyes fleayi]|uniref:triggering receptor expressed on myeloid cells 2-like n=1 Tax=Mixophyes fleayi TaxID=3061075 RepID=UPI003F4DAE4C
MDTCFTLIYFIILLGVSDLCLAKDTTVYSGHLGETLTIVCPYQNAERWGKKIWCKEDHVGFCQPVVSAHRYWQSFVKRTNGNTDISDNKQDYIFTINITNLQKNDTGMYQCKTATFGDVSILQRIQVQVLEGHLHGNISELEKVQYSISGLQSESQIPLTLVILGSSLLLCKLLMMGLICSWWKSQQTRNVNEDSCAIPSSGELLSAGTQADECFLPCAREETTTCPQYINYVSMGHLTQTY